MGDTSSAAAPGGAESPDTTHSAFFYGTLMAPEVLFTVLFRASRPTPEVTRSYSFRPAVLHGYCRRRVINADYPGIVHDADHSVRGTLVSGLTDANVTRLDFFEGSEYERRRVKLRLLLEKKKSGGGGGDDDDKTAAGEEESLDEEKGEEVEAQTYVFKYRSELEDREWDFEEFRREKMKHWAREDFTFEG